MSSSSPAATGASAWPAPAPSPTPATGWPSPTAPTRPRPTRPPGSLAVTCDVTDADQVDAAFAEIEETLGPVEVLVSNAGMTADMLVLRMSDDDFTGVLDANLAGGLPGRQARRAEDDAGPLGSDHLPRLGRGLDRPGRPGQLRRVQGRPGRASPVPSPGSSRPGTSPSTSWRPDPVATDMFAAVSDDARAAIESAVPLGRLAEPVGGRRRGRLPGLRRRRLRHRRRAARRRRPRHGRRPDLRPPPTDRSRPIATRPDYAWEPPHTRSKP